MSIIGQLQQLTNTNQLHHWQPSIASIGCVRHVYVSSTVQTFLADIHNSDQDLASTIGRTRAKLDAFCGGKTIVFSLTPFGKSPATLVSRNKPVERGIVEFRPTAYNPDVRLFGGFAATDVLVLLTWAYKTGIVYKSEVAACHTVWKAMFGTASPIVGETHAEYISSNVIAG